MDWLRLTWHVFWRNRGRKAQQRAKYRMLRAEYRANMHNNYAHTITERLVAAGREIPAKESK